MKINLNFTNNAKETANSMGVAFNKMRKHNQSVINLTKDNNRLGLSLGVLTKNFLSFAAAIKTGQALSKFIQSALDSIETVNLFTVAMGQNAEASNEFAESISRTSGLDLTNVQNAVGTYGLLARSMGMSSDNAKVLAENTYKLALDLSSVVNVPIQQALSDLRSGLVGQSETVYKYGVDVTEAALKTEALAQGITKSVRNMSQGEKMALRYSAMLRQTAIVQGDFANTINTPANQLRILAERFVTLGRAIGTMFIPMLQVVIPVINGIVSALTSMFARLAKLFGYNGDLTKVTNKTGLGAVTDDADNASASLEKTNKGLDKTKDKLKKIKDYTTGIDELNILSDDSSSGGGSGGSGGGVGGGGIDFDLQGYDNGINGIQTTAETVAQRVQEIFSALTKNTGDSNAMFIGFGTNMATALNREFNSINLSFGTGKIQGFVDGVLTNLILMFNSTIQRLNWSSVGVTLANAINLGVFAINTFWGKVDFAGLGSGFARLLNTAITDTDWSAIGLSLVGKYNGVTDFLYNAILGINWSNIGSAIATTFNSAISNIEMSKFMESEALFINGLFTSLGTFVTEFNWANLTNTIGNAINTAINTLDVGLMASGLYRLTRNILGSLVNLIGLVNWAELGTKVSNLITGIDWGGIALDLSNLAHNFFTAVIDFVQNIDWFQLGVKIGNFISNIDWLQLTIDLANLGVSLLKGLIDIVTGLGEGILKGLLEFDWLGGLKKVFNGFMSILKSLFGIHSPSKVMYDEIGTPSGDGLVNGLSDTVNGSESKFSQMWDNMKTWCNNGWTKIDTWWKESAISKWFNKDGAIGEWFESDKWTGFWDNTKTWTTNGWTVVDTWWKDNAICKWFNKDGEVGKWFESDKWSGFWDKTKQWTELGWQVVTDWWNESAICKWFNTDGAVGKWFESDTWSKLWDKVKSWFSNGWDKVVNWWNGDTGIKAWWNDNVASWFTWEQWSSLFTTLTSSFKSGFKDAWNGAIGVCETAINWIRVKINSLMSIKVPDLLGGGTYGLQIPYISLNKFKAYAKGGMVSSGELFQAGENGKAELIGSHNNQTTVMPLENTDFVKAIYNAVSSAMNNNTNNNNGGTTIVKIGDEVVYKSVDNARKRKGYAIATAGGGLL